MSAEAVEQARVFFACLAGGAAIAVVFDFFRIIRRSIGGELLDNLCDACFWLVGGLFFAAFLYRVNGLQLRLYVYAAIICGAAVYFFVISRFVVAAGVFAAGIIKKILIFIIKIFAVPIAFFLRKTERAVLIVLSPIRKLNKKTGKLRRKFIFDGKIIKKI